MATAKCRFIFSLILAISISSTVDLSLAARHLLQTTGSALPNPINGVPPLPAIPTTLPTALPPMPSLPNTQIPTALPPIPSLPNNQVPTFPNMPSLPTTTLPPMPSLPTNIIPITMPNLPTSIPSIPVLTPPPSN